MGRVYRSSEVDRRFSTPVVKKTAQEVLNFDTEA